MGEIEKGRCPHCKHVTYLVGGDQIASHRFTTVKHVKHMICPGSGMAPLEGWVGLPKSATDNTGGGMGSRWYPGWDDPANWWTKPYEPKPKKA